MVRPLPALIERLLYGSPCIPFVPLRYIEEDHRHLAVNQDVGGVSFGKYNRRHFQMGKVVMCETYFVLCAPLHYTDPVLKFSRLGPSKHTTPLFAGRKHTLRK